MREKSPFDIKQKLLKSNLETQGTTVSTRRHTNNVNSSPSRRQCNGDQSNFIECFTEDEEEIDQKNFNLADIDLKHMNGGGQQQFQTVDKRSQGHSPEYRNNNSALGALRLKIMSSSIADTYKQSASIVEQASPKSQELESIKSYGSSSFLAAEAKYKTETKRKSSPCYPLRPVN